MYDRKWIWCGINVAPGGTKVGTEATIELPDGTYPAKLDEKGRLKLPATFQRYFEKLAEKKLFVTSLDGRIGTIYPISVWRANMNVLENLIDEAETADDVLLIANELGSDTEVDAQGRVLIHPDLRRALGIENQPVKLVPIKGRIDVYSEPVYEERRRQAKEELQQKLLRLRSKGLK